MARGRGPLVRALLALGAIGTLAGGRITRGVVPRVLELSLGLVAVTVGGATRSWVPWARAGRAATRRPRSPARPAAPRAPRRRDVPAVSSACGRCSRCFAAWCVAVPIVAVFALLFASADAVFARITGDLLAWRPDLDLAGAIERAVVIGVVAWCWAGLLVFAAGHLPALVRHGSAPRPAGRTGAATAPRLADGLRAGPPAPVGRGRGATILVVVVVLFAVFVALQVAYLFGGLDTLAADRDDLRGVRAPGVLRAARGGRPCRGARRGRWTWRWRAGHVPSSCASLVLLALTAVVLVSAFVRLRLYQDAYGWTELRFVIVVSIGWLAVALVAVAGLLLMRRTAWILHALGILLLVAWA